LTRHRDPIVAQLCNHIEICSFADPRAPKLIRAFILDIQLETID
jgi:hypothetical protein